MQVLFMGSKIVPSLSLLVGVLRLVKDKRHPHGILAGLRLLKIISSQESLGNSIVSIGGVPQLVEMLPHFNSECLELALYVLQLLSLSPDGVLALKVCPNTIPNLVKLLMKISESCTHYALSILWEVCKISPEESAAIAVNAGLAAKLLLVIQSGCNPGLKQRSAELLKLCSLNYTSTIFISKCKLTRTLQWGEKGVEIVDMKALEFLNSSTLCITNKRVDKFGHNSTRFGWIDVGERVHILATKRGKMRLRMRMRMKMMEWILRMPNVICSKVNVLVWVVVFNLVYKSEGSVLQFEGTHVIQFCLNQWIMPRVGLQFDGKLCKSIDFSIYDYSNGKRQ